MVKQIFLTISSNEPVQALYEKELRRLKQPGASQQRLADIDNRKSLRRIYVMGCGRSGTWLLTHVMATFSGVEVVPRELPVEYFGMLMTDSSVLVLKRNQAAYQWTQQIGEHRTRLHCPSSLRCADESASKQPKALSHSTGAMGRRSDGAAPFGGFTKK